MKLPDTMLLSADRSSNEEAWSITEFPHVLDVATEHQLACIGGQFQFRGPIGTAEMYWLNADSDPKTVSEDWPSYVARANSQVRHGFDRLVATTDFQREAQDWEHIRKALEEGLISNPMEHLVFVAYFNQNPE